MSFDELEKRFKELGCQRLFIKQMAANDNSKNQVYLGSNFDILNVFPLQEITADDSGDWNKTRFKSRIDFSWITENGLSPAPFAQLILYPKYPEVRFSGFLKSVSNAPSVLMASRSEGRVLVLGIGDQGKVFGFVSGPNEPVSHATSILANLQEYGVFHIHSLKQELNDSKAILLEELKRINSANWIDSKRLNSEGEVMPCTASNCGGYTLEAELGITPNGYSEPDFLGWEIKQFGVKKFANLQSSVITLMTPEPNGGLYKDSGVKEFIRKYGYEDKKNRPDRLNFGGIHRANQVAPATNLRMVLEGFDSVSKKIRNAQGYIALISKDDEIAASWSFSSLLKHWNRKHKSAAYIPSLKQNLGYPQYKYGNEVIVGEGTDFGLFLSQMEIGNIYYDPGIKMENVSTTQKVKRRSQFRIKSKHLGSLYKVNELIQLHPSE